MKAIRFRFSPEKGRAAIQWMLTQAQFVDLHSLLKSCYFADKKHLNEHGRPVFGALYRAMKFGPVPIEIYQMARSEPLWLAELSVEKFPWNMFGYHLEATDKSNVDMSSFSKSDLDALEIGFKKSRSMSFDQRTLATHGPDWQKANLGYMLYEDMLDDTPDKEEKIAYLREAAPHIKI
jgi:hypothetical protein